MYGIQEIQICMHIMIASIYITVRNYNEVMCAQVNGSQLVCNMFTVYAVYTKIMINYTMVLQKIFGDHVH